MSTNPPLISPTGVKTHHYGMIIAFLSAAITAYQGYNGETVNLTDPTVWTTMFGFIMTIVGLVRNTPQGQLIKP